MRWYTYVHDRTLHRIAAIIKPYAGTSTGFVLAGRSLRQVELRATQLLAEVVVAWLIALGASLCAVVALALTKPLSSMFSGRTG